MKRFMKILILYLNKNAWFMCKIYDADYIYTWEDCKNIIKRRESK